MNDFHLAATGETPEIHFEYSRNRLSVAGESYPENAMTFYAPIRSSLAQYLEQLSADAAVEAHFAFKYFNSSSTKLIRHLIGMLNEAASRGARVALHWYHDPDDDMMMEFGMDLGEEYRQIALKVRLLETA